LGHIVSKEEVTIDYERVEAIKLIGFPGNKKRSAILFRTNKFSQEIHPQFC
jgi:hypothetical protein